MNETTLANTEKLSSWRYPDTVNVTDNLEPHLYVAVPGTPFILAALHPDEKSNKYLVGSAWYLFSLVIMAILVLLSVIVGYHTQSNNLVLTTKIAASKKHSQLLRNNNRLLEIEIQKRHEFADKLTHQANFDVLTELPNRNLAMDRLYQALVRMERQKKCYRDVSRLGSI